MGIKSIDFIKKSRETYWDELGKSGTTYQMGMTKHRQHVLDVIKEYKVKSILDVGCGTGPIFGLLLDSKEKTMPDYKGVDYSKKFINIAKRTFNTYRDLFEVQDARKLKEKDNSYDLVLLMHVLDHVDKWKKVIKEAKRVSKKYILIILWRSFTTEPDWLHQTVMNNTLYEDTYLHEYRKEDLEAEFKRRKLKVIHQQEIINDDNHYNYCFLLQK